MKKRIICLLVAACVLGTAGCGKKKEEPVKEPEVEVKEEVKEEPEQPKPKPQKVVEEKKDTNRYFRKQGRRKP